MKKKAIIICLVCICLISFILIRYKMVDSTFYQYKKQIITEFKYVDKVELRNYGPYCTVAIYVKDKHFDYEELEPVFIKAMTEIYQESNFQYFLEEHIKSASGEMAFLKIHFYNRNEEELYRFTSYKDFDIWELESNRSVQFRVSDYLQRSLPGDK